MKCKAWIIKYINGKRVGKVFRSIHSGIAGDDVAKIVYSHNLRSNDKVEFAEFCDGEMSMEIEPVEEPCFGGTYPRIKTTHTCSKCGKTFHPKLPSGEFDLNEFINDMIKVME